MARASSIVYLFGIAALLTFVHIVAVDVIAREVQLSIVPIAAVFSVIIALLAFLLFPVALWGAVEGTLEYWGYGMTDAGTCCHMGTISDGFAISGMLQSGAPAAIVSSVVVVQWLVWRRVKVNTSLMIAVPASVIWTANASAAYSHALRMCGSC